MHTHTQNWINATEKLAAIVAITPKIHRAEDHEKTGLINAVYHLAKAAQDDLLNPQPEETDEQP